MSDVRAIRRTSPRERYRAQIRDEIKQVALRQLAQLGPSGVSVNAIGKELGVTGPAFYRYFASRDELLTELVVDAYTDMAVALRSAADKASGTPARSSLEALARASIASGRSPILTATGCYTPRYFPATTPIPSSSWRRLKPPCNCSWMRCPQQMEPSSPRNTWRRRQPRGRRPEF